MMNNKSTLENVVLFWFRRDLRLEDNHGLYKALTSGYPVVPVFIFDREILDQLEDPADARVEFIHKTLTELKSALQSFNSDIRILHGTPLQAFAILLKEYRVQAIYTNTDYEP
ncbi:MAG: deoxyribodipyrimidine photo-lyase, partial [Cytophaga sp.]|uniref:deoxyribodipyrimidine photo-lyase n=1 Tax=Cytophaga sp. TaxID=29535 RepID=UPI003F80510B